MSPQDWRRKIRRKNGFFVREIVGINLHGYIDGPLTSYPSVQIEGIPVAACITTQIQGLEDFKSIPRLVLSRVYDQESLAQIPEGFLAAASILKKIYQRGFPTRLSPWLETAVLAGRLSCCKIKLEKTHAYKILIENESSVVRLNSEVTIDIPEEFSKDIGEYFGSVAEENFYYQVLPFVFGEDYWKYTYLQVPLASVLNGYETKEFLDFFVCMPDGCQYVIEIDGPGHDTPKQRASDQRRDSRLLKSGIRTIRINLMQCNSISGQQQYMMREVSIVKDSNTNSLNQLHLCATDCLAIQYALTSAISDGAVDVSKSECHLLVISSLTQEIVDLCVRETCHSLRELLKIYSFSKEKLPAFKVTTTSRVGQKCDADLVIFASSSVSSVSVDPLIVHNCYGLNTIVVASEFHSFHFKCPKVVEDMSMKVDIARKDSLTFFLQMIFWKSEFRPLQSEGILRALSGKDSIVLLPTGSGKSIVYQLTALLSAGLCVCIAPLVSLVADQVRVLKSSHYITRVFGFYSGATQTTSEREKALSLFANGELYFVFLTPERFQQNTFQKLFKVALEKFVVSQVVIDEAHVVSEWGHDFRPAYLRISQILSETFMDIRPTFLALTATAARNVLRDVQRQLKINDPSSVISPTSFDRHNLSFRIVKAPVNGGLDSLRSALERIPGELGFSSEEFWTLHGEETKAGLVFVLTVNGKRSIVDVKNEVLSYLSNFSLNSYSGVDIYSSKSPRALAMNSGQWDVKKTESANLFIDNKIHTLVATSAFGMGIDKPNVRFTINLGLPSSIESFYQQAGRAGRDGHNSLCYLIFEASDIDVQSLEKDDWHSFNVEGLDLATQSFFLKNSFPGVQVELDELKFLFLFLEENQGKRVNVIQRETDGFNKPKHAIASMEKGSFVLQSNNVLYCLATLERLGIVSDLQVDYSGCGDMNISVVVTKDIQKESVSARIYDNEYLYDPAYAERLARLVTDLDENLTITKSYNIWLDAKYETILKGRLRSLRELARNARDGLSGDEFKKKIELYLTDDIYSAELDKLVSSGENQLKSFVALGAGKSTTEWQELGLQAGRLLESSPNNPGLLVLRALSIINEGESSFDVAFEELSRAISSRVNISGDTVSKVKDEIWSAVSSMGSWGAIQFIVSDVGQLTNAEKEYYLNKMPSYKGADAAEIGHLMVELDSLNHYLELARQITTKTPARIIL